MFDPETSVACLALRRLLVCVFVYLTSKLSDNAVIVDCACVCYVAALPFNCVCIALVTLSTYPISVDDTVPMLVVEGNVTVPVKVGDASKARRYIFVLCDARESYVCVALVLMIVLAEDHVPPGPICVGSCAASMRVRKTPINIVNSFFIVLL